MGNSKSLISILAVVVVIAAGLWWYLGQEEPAPPAPAPTPPAAAVPPFGGEADVAYAASVWALMGEMSLAGPGASVADVYPGGAPHGELLETVTTTATVDGHEGTLIIKKNFVAPEGETITTDQVAADPDAYLVAVTIMFQRADGYDAANQNWFWAKYLPDGSMDKNPAGMQLAGKVGNREANAGCLGCHDDAPGEDYIFTN